MSLVPINFILFHDMMIIIIIFKIIYQSIVGTRRKYYGNIKQTSLKNNCKKHNYYAGSRSSSRLNLIIIYKTLICIIKNKNK